VIEEPTTCGEGLAANAELPRAASALLQTMADNLEAHLATLDLSDGHARRERDACLHLAAEQRRIAARLDTVAEEMAGYRELPQGRHDHEALASDAVRSAFARFAAARERMAQATGGG
jgi:hypothetical protein